MVVAENLLVIEKTEEYENFTKALKLFYKHRSGNSNYTTVPHFITSSINILSFYKSVTDRGGYEKMSEEKSWNSIYREIDIAERHNWHTRALRLLYLKQLSEFEWEFEGKIPALNEVESKIENNQWNRNFGDPGPKQAVKNIKQKVVVNVSRENSPELANSRPKRNCTMKPLPSFSPIPSPSSEPSTNTDDRSEANRKKRGRPKESTRIKLNSIHPRPTLLPQPQRSFRVVPPVIKQPNYQSIPTNLCFLNHPDRLDPMRLARRIYFSFHSNLPNEIDWSFRILLEVTYQYESPFIVDDVILIFPELSKYLKYPALTTETANTLVILNNLASQTSIAQYLATCPKLIEFLYSVLLDSSSVHSLDSSMLNQEILLNSLDLMESLGGYLTLEDGKLLKKLIGFCYSNDQAVVCKSIAILTQLFYHVPNEPHIDHLSIDLYQHLTSFLLLPSAFKIHADAESDDQIHTMISLALNLLCLMIKYFSPLEEYYQTRGSGALLPLLIKYLDGLINTRPLPSTAPSTAYHYLSNWLDKNYHPHPTCAIPLKQMCAQFKRDHPSVTLSPHQFTKGVLRHLPSCQFGQFGVNSDIEFYFTGIQHRPSQPRQYRGRESGYQVGLDILHWLAKIDALKGEFLSHRGTILEWQLKGIQLNLDLGTLSNI